MILFVSTVSTRTLNFLSLVVAVFLLGVVTTENSASASSQASALTVPKAKHKRNTADSRAARGTGQNLSQKLNQRAKRRLARKDPHKPNLRGVSKKDVLSPSQFVDARVQKLLVDLNARPIRTAGESGRIEVDTAANRAQFLNSLYQRDLVDASWPVEMLSDKLIMARALERELGARAKIYYPKTLGLREFLVKRSLVGSDGHLLRDGDKIEAALHDEFPAGFVVRPAVGIAPTETGRGMFQEGDQFIVRLLAQDSPLYQPQHLRQPVVSHILGEVASGEAVVLQENFVAAADAHKPLKHHLYQEVRIHTFEGRVVSNAVPNRWVQVTALSRTQIHDAEAFAQDFLKSLPLALLNRQAWGIDVGVVDNGEMRIVDIVTNRGKRLPWSSYLDQPRVLGAYARHIETFYGIKFAGLSGALLRHNFGNYFPYWGKRIDKAQRGIDKMLAYLPPFP